MARAPKSATIEQITTTDLYELDYEVPALTISSPYLVLTNASNNVIDVSIYINNTVNDFLIAREKIPGGIGKERYVKELSTQKLNAGFKIKLQCTTADTFNAFLSVSEISNS